MYEEELKWHCERFTKNKVEPKFTDQELLTTYLFGVGLERGFQIKQIHRYTHQSLVELVSGFSDLL